MYKDKTSRVGKGETSRVGKGGKMNSGLRMEIYNSKVISTCIKIKKKVKNN